MGNKSALLLLVLALSYALVTTVSGYEDDQGWRKEMREESEGGHQRMEGDDWFLLQHSKQVVKTDAGHMRVVRGYRARYMKNPMHVGFITMEPRSLFIPQYLDCSLILFIRTGEARLGYIYKDEMAEKRLQTGDVYRIPAGSAFYLVNRNEGKRLHIICSIDTSESLGWHTYQSFFVGGGTYPTSVLAGFDPSTLSTAFNVSKAELREILTREKSGPILYLSDSDHSQSSIWTKFLELEQHHRLAHLKRMVRLEEEDSSSEEDKEQPTWSWRKLLISVFGEENKKRVEKRSTRTGPDSYNLYKRRPDFQNKYGWSMALDDSDYSPLRHSGIGIYLVNLSAGSMMAPHINPTATEYGIVLRGTGTIQIVYPNGTLAMRAKVREGNVFWVPRYFPFCQIASTSGSFEFFGFTTSARKNRPQFLVGASSLLETMRGPEMAAAYGVSEERLRNIINAQRESVILPSSSASVASPEMEIPNVIRGFGNDMIMELED